MATKLSSMTTDGRKWHHDYEVTNSLECDDVTGDFSVRQPLRAEENLKI